MPEVPAATPPPKREPQSKAATEKRNSMAKKAKLRRGAKSTILTSGMGVKDEATVKKPTLLGQA